MIDEINLNKKEINQTGFAKNNDQTDELREIERIFNSKYDNEETSENVVEQNKTQQDFKVN